MKYLDNITQKELKNILDYNPKTGTFIWKKKTSRMSRIKVGQIAGSLDSKGYSKIKIYKIHYRASRLAWLYMTGNWPEFEIDHKNRIRDDDSWGNLRESTHSQNKANVGIMSNNSSGYKGVSWSKNNNKWIVNIMINGKSKYLGLYTDKKIAALAYNKAAEKLHDKFAVLNDIQ